MTDREPFYFDPHAAGAEVFLGPTEAMLMELAWEKKSLTVKKALFFLNDQSGRAYTTIMTVLNRLARKGFLTREKTGRYFTYTPVVDRKTFLADRVKVVRDCIKRNFAK